MKTGHQIVSDIYSLLKGSALVQNVSGGLYRGGTRPRDSKSEDVVVLFTTADAEQVQEGTVTINVFVPDIIPNMDNGVPVEDIRRCEEIEGLLMDEVRSWTAGVSDYKFRLKDTVHTNRDIETEQSFVVARLGFRLY